MLKQFENRSAGERLTIRSCACTDASPAHAASPARTHFHPPARDLPPHARTPRRPCASPAASACTPCHRQIATPGTGDRPDCSPTTGQRPRLHSLCGRLPARQPARMYDRKTPNQRLIVRLRPLALSIDGADLSNRSFALELVHYRSATHEKPQR